MMHSEDGDYSAVCISCMEKLKCCASFCGADYAADSALLYNLYVKHIGSSGVGSDIINRNKCSQDGHKCFVELQNHFQSPAYLKDAVTSSISVNLVCILSTHPGTKMSPFSKYYNFTAMQPNSHLIAPSKRVNCDLQNEPGLKLIELIFKKL